MTERNIIAFSDIKKGDIVKTTRVFDGGFTLTMEGVAERRTVDFRGDASWYMDSHCVASEYFGVKAQDTIELIKREEPREWVVAGFKDDGTIDQSIANFDIMTESKAKETAQHFCETYKYSTRYSRHYKALRVEIPA